MNTTLKTILLTVLTLSAFVIALVELSGISSTAFINKYKAGHNHANEISNDEQTKKDSIINKMPKTILEVKDKIYDFGTIKEGDIVRHTYIIKNIGNQPLVISNVQVSCGCTAPFYPKEPILPNKEAEITLEFNSAGKEGKVNKNAMIIANAENAPFSIGFTSLVEKK